VIGTVDISWLGVVLILGAIIMVSLWLLNKLFPRATISHLAGEPNNRTDIADESGIQLHSSQKQHQDTTGRLG
jgi:hypothetical protein